jgi:hypothetical protein
MEMLDKLNHQRKYIIDSSSEIYKKYDIKFKFYKIDEFINSLLDNDDENNTGKSLLMCEYILDHLEYGYFDGRLNKIMGILSHGHGWKLRRYFKIILLRTNRFVDDNALFELRKFINERIKSCYI